MQSSTVLVSRVKQTFLMFNHAAVTPVGMTFPLIKRAVAFMSVCHCHYYYLKWD